MRAKPSSNTRAGKSNRASGKSQGRNSRGIVKKNKDPDKKTIPDLSILRQPVDTSISGLKQAVKVFETGTPEILHLLTYDCDVVYECKVCRNLFRSIANFISHKRVYCTLRYSRSQDLMRSNKQVEDYTVILGEQATEKLPTRITARKDLTSIVESLSGPGSDVGEKFATHNAEKKATTLHLEPMENTSYGVFQTVLKPDSQDLMRNQVAELQSLLSQNEVILGPDGRILQNGFSDLLQGKMDVETNDENGLMCSVCKVKFANRKTLTKHKRIMHESVRTSYSCPCCKNYFANPWSVYRHLYKGMPPAVNALIYTVFVLETSKLMWMMLYTLEKSNNKDLRNHFHKDFMFFAKKTNEQVRRLRSQIHKKDIIVEKIAINDVSNKKLVSPSKKKLEADHRQKILQHNKEWMDHFEDDWELQRCGGCGRKFERKAALISHSQICQKRIAACNRIEQNHQGTFANLGPVASVSPMPCSKKPVPKQVPEKKIGIQVRMNYCKNNSNCSALMSQVSGRQRSCSRSVFGDDSDIEAVSVDGKEPFFQQGLVKNSPDSKKSSELEHLAKNTNKCRVIEGLDKVNSYVNNASNRIDKVHHTYEISTCKRATYLRSSVNRNKNLEAKCSQLRSVLENGITESIKNEVKDKDIENPGYFDGNVDNTSESNTSAISSLSSQLTPLVDKGYGCELEQSIEINISRTLENIPSTEADSTSMPNGSSLHMTYNSHMYKGNIKFFPNGDATCEEVSTSVISDEIPQINSNLHIDSSCLNDDEISLDLKPISLPQLTTKSGIQECELENTISILTRNQLKAICKDDLLPANEDRKMSSDNEMMKKENVAEIEAATREITKKKFCKYIDEKNNTCSICNKKFTKIRSVYRHIPIHTRWKRYECLFNGCTYQSFYKKPCSIHIAQHTKENSGESSVSLVGLISPSKWNIKLIEKSKTLTQLRTGARVAAVARCKETASQKMVKTVNRLSKKPLNTNKTEKERLKSKRNNLIETKRNTISKLLTKVSTKQKLLTDFSSFKEMSNLKGKKVTQSKEIKKKMLQSPKRIVSAVNKSPRRIKSSQVENFSVADTSPPRSESMVIKSRGSRASSRKSSVNSVDQQKGRISNSIAKVEESNSTSHFSTISYESRSSPHIQSPEIVDGSSLEEEESQESDRPVDDSHLKKIFMEVIFGPQTHSVQSLGRPVRNKTRPKRDNDFVLGSHKDSDKETVEEKPTSIKKNSRSVLECKTSQESSRKSK